jgi:hypothetical protein
MNVIAMGTCRIGTWDKSLFSQHQVENPTAKEFKPFTTQVSNSKNVNLYVNPTGYCTSPPEFVDLLKVLHGDLAWIDKKEISMYKEIHKYLDSEVFTHINYDHIILEICSRRFLKAPLELKTKYAWDGCTLPYKVMQESTRNEFSFENLNAQFKSNILLSDSEIENYIATFLNIAKVPPKNIHILGNYIFPESCVEGQISLPLTVANHRKKLNDLLYTLSKSLGFQYLDFSEILELDKDTSSLSDLFHLSELGVKRLSAYIHDLVLV